MRETILVNSLQRAEGGPDHISRVSGRSRYYEVLGARLPSVTTIIGATIPKPALYNWYAKRGREAMVEYLADHLGEPVTPRLLADAFDEAKTRPSADAAKAADLGSLAHVAISDELTTGKRGSVAPEIQPVMQAFHAWQEKEELELVETETAVYHLGYAGTIDALFKKPDGTFLLIDWKTSKNFYFPDMALQTWAYIEAIPIPEGASIRGQVVRLGKEEPDFEIHDIGDVSALWAATLGLYNETVAANEQQQLRDRG